MFKSTCQVRYMYETLVKFNLQNIPFMGLYCFLFQNTACERRMQRNNHVVKGLRVEIANTA